MEEIQKPSVAIVLVNYNGYDDTVECINSLKKILYKNFSIIIVDNGSNDDSANRFLMLENSNIKVICEKDNLGFSGGNNVGIEWAIKNKFDYILLLNNDTLVDSDFLGEMLKAAKKYHNKALITGKILYAFDKKRIWYAGGSFNQITSRTTHTGMGQIDEGQYDKEHLVSFASGCCMLIPKEIMNSVGYLSEDYFLYCEDLDYCCRLLKRGYKILYCPSARVYHKVNASSSKQSGAIIYYIVRNKMYIIKRYISFKYKLIANLYNFLETLKRLLTKEYEKEFVIKAFSDYKKGYIGKLD